ncbi:spinster family MFS transporter [Sphingobium nicotianae]|uniref:MFS transporter n=1 Tax=Sphingobium nicotianae TaxID=2782607 RepID=A0A9X1DDW5_9SPHN|nr:MFS transporter [Sphingobium nicotianae]MBT2188246.1 MFS transporter [Sphingobium nicotianae]
MAGAANITMDETPPKSTGDAAPAMASGEQPWPPRKDAYYSLVVMTIVVMFTVLDRSVLALLIDPIKQDFGITDTQAALLLGAAFSLPYGICGMGIARIADRTNRRNLVAVCIAFWSACTVACGVAQGYVGLFLARIGIGIGESGYGPASWSIATDNFPREKVAFATGTYGIGAMVGTGLALFLGGTVLHLVEGIPPIDVPLIGTIRPWQWTFVVVGAPGLLWTLVVLTTKEPPRRGLVAGQKALSVPVKEVARWVFDDGRTYLAVIGGHCMKTLLSAGPATWGATFLHREFHWDLAKVGIISGAITIVVSPIAMILGGKLSEYWTRQGRNDANLRIVFFGLICSVPLMVIAPLIPNAYGVLAMNALASFIGTLGFGPGIAAFQVVTPNRMRAQVSSLSQFSTNVIAFALSPLIVALFTDYVFRDEGALKYSMVLNAALMGGLALLVVWQGLKPYARSYERAVREFAN